MTITIRSAGLDDAEAIAKIRVLSWQAGYPGLVPQAVLDAMSVANNTERTRKRMLDPALRRADDWLAWRGDDALGWLGAGRCRDDDLQDEGVGEVVALYALPSAWGQGVGHALILFADDVFRSQGYGKSAVWVMQGNTRAEQFYQRQGFQFDGARRPLGMKDVPGHLRRLTKAL
ncbi:MAG TPA: N-acetyltransferase [Deltaproteobacteria bacterium]|nr:GNAT family N-acetyltransferase [Deltaproteobacteria bacterium]HCP46561.1 N-acetyltransferase [Deltaproteobacteria bacterium]